jgi:hypothetical protein
MTQPKHDNFLTPDGHPAVGWSSAPDYSIKWASGAKPGGGVTPAAILNAALQRMEFCQLSSQSTPQLAQAVALVSKAIACLPQENPQHDDAPEFEF